VNITLHQECAKLPLSHKEKAVLFALASFAPRGCREAYPSVDSLASHTALSATSVRKSLRILESEGVVVPQGNTKGGGRGHTTLYFIVPENYKPDTRLLPLSEINPTPLDAKGNTFDVERQHTSVAEGKSKGKAVVAEPAAAVLENQMANELDAVWSYYLEAFRKDEDFSPSAKRIGLAILTRLREKYPSISSEQSVDAMSAAIDAAKKIANAQPKKAFFKKWFGIFGNFDTFHSLWEEA
jgi:hypothetical protein